MGQRGLRGNPEGEGLPSDLAAMSEGEVLRDRHREDCYRVAGIDGIGITLHRDGVDFYVPCSLFAGWYGRRLFPIDEAGSVELPEWCCSRDDAENGPRPKNPASES